MAIDKINFSISIENDSKFTNESVFQKLKKEKTSKEEIKINSKQKKHTKTK